jgi:hypothetical protein
MKNALIILLMAVSGLGLAGQAVAAFRISGLHCVRSRPDQGPQSQAAPDFDLMLAPTGKEHDKVVER